MNVAEALRLGTESLSTAAVPSAEREASSLLKFVLKCDTAFVYAHPEHRLNAVESILFKAVVKRRSAHEPFQYITGVQEFYGLEFAVNRDVLIPRPETEILVECAIQEFHGREAIRFCEIGIGSGCISVSILKNVVFATAIGLDVSDAALQIAAQNAESHSVSSRLQLVRSDVFEGVHDERFDLIVSNPPYVPENVIETLQEEVRSFEPRAALIGGSDGLRIVRTIIRDSPKYLTREGLLLIEIGWDQSEKVKEFLDPRIWKDVEFLPDLQGIPRILKAKRR